MEVPDAVEFAALEGTRREVQFAQDIRERLVRELCHALDGEIRRRRRAVTGWLQAAVEAGDPEGFDFAAHNVRHWLRLRRASRWLWKKVKMERRPSWWIDIGPLVWNPDSLVEAWMNRTYYDPSWPCNRKILLRVAWKAEVDTVGLGRPDYRAGFVRR